MLKTSLLNWPELDAMMDGSVEKKELLIVKKENEILKQQNTVLQRQLQLTITDLRLTQTRYECLDEQYSKLRTIFVDIIKNNEINSKLCAPHKVKQKNRLKRKRALETEKLKEQYKKAYGHRPRGRFASDKVWLDRAIKKNSGGEGKPN